MAVSTTEYGPNQRGYATTFYDQALHALAHAEVPLQGVQRGPGDMQFTTDASSCIILSAAALEAGINEVIVWYQAGFEGPVELPEDLLEDPIRDKWQALAMHVKGRSFDKGAAPWQDFDALIGLRDALMHFKWMERGSKKVIARLKGQSLLLPHSDWLSAAMNNHVAQWSVDTVAAMFAGLEKILEKENRESWLWGSRGFAKRAVTRRST